MTELFSNVSKSVKDKTKFWVELALMRDDPKEAAKEVLAFRNSLKNEEEQDFVDFYFNMRLLQERENEDKDNSN